VDSDMLLAVVIIGFCLLIPLVMMVLALRGQSIKLERAHRERMKALEMGLLPEVLRAQGDNARTRAAGAVGVTVPLLMAGAAVGGTYLVLTWGDLSWRLTVLCVIWGVCGVVNLVTVTTSLDVLRRASRGLSKATPGADHELPPPVSLTAIKGATPPLRPE
jgi:hypothetical protein